MAVPQSMGRAQAVLGLLFMEFSQFQTSLALTGKCTGNFSIRGGIALS